MIKMFREEYERKEEEEEYKSPFQEELQDAIEEQREEVEEDIKEEEKKEEIPDQDYVEERFVQQERDVAEEEEEVVEEEKVKAKPAVAEEKVVEEEKKKEERVVYSHIDVDLWRTKLHKEEWGIRLDAQRAQKDRQWTRDMDMIGEIKVDKEPFGGLAIREKIWKHQDQLERRFVMKVFSPSGYWRGSIERLQGESFANSLATKEPCPSYVCILKHTRNLFRIKRLAHFPRFQGEVFGFSYLDENDIFQSFVIDDKRPTFGSDWMIKNIRNEVVAKINGKFANIGGRFKVDIFDPMLAKDKTFTMIMILFSSTLRFHKQIKKNIKKSIKQLKNTDAVIKLDDSEANLYLNPRKLSV
jgi:hypothetical protein